MAEVQDVTAEHGEVHIDRGFLRPSATADGNPAVASSLQGMAEQGVMSGVFLRSWRVCERWREGKAWSGCTGTEGASTAHADMFWHGRGVVLGVDVLTSGSPGGVVRWR